LETCRFAACAQRPPGGGAPVRRRPGVGKDGCRPVALEHAGVGRHQAPGPRVGVTAGAVRGARGERRPSRSAHRPAAVRAAPWRCSPCCRCCRARCDACGNPPGPGARAW
jgi:hypothetical protein